MTRIKELLEKRNKMNKKIPAFFRKEHYRKKKIGSGWRKARGLDNKQRLQKRGAPLRPSIGYRGPREARGLHKSGLLPIIVSNVAQLNNVTKELGVIISGKIGDRKRQAILNEIKKKGIALLNLDVDKAIEKIQVRFKQRDDAKKEKLAETKDEKEKKKNIDEKLKKAEASKQKLAVPEKLNFSEVKKEEIKKEEAKKEEHLELSEEEKKKQEKEEKDKLLTKRE